ncbi:DNA-binding protein H-NS [Burkholderia latens]|uniref:H-NS histone family protein n=1 Tax=Burkholderia latens TaxID=488446 RepID=UPI0039A51546
MATENYFDLKQQLAELQARVDAAREHAKKDAIARIKKEMADLGITIEELGGSSRVRTNTNLGKKIAKPPIKYRDPESGQTWTGRGREPAWIRGKDPKQFEIPPEPQP